MFTAAIASRIATLVCVYAPGIDQQYVTLAARILNPIDDPAFAVRLKRLDLHFKFASQPLQFLVDIGQAGSAVNFGFAFAEQIKVGSMNHQHRDRGRLHRSLRLDQRFSRL